MRQSAFVLAAIGLLLAGCAAQQTREATAHATSCLSAAYASPEAAPFRAREPFNASDATLQQLSDSSLATPEEIRSIEATFPRLKSCENRLIAELRGLAPTIAPLFAENARLAEDDMLALVERRMSWGEFTRRRRDRAIAFQALLAREQERLTEAQRERVNAAILGMAAVYAATHPPPAPHLSCFQNGPYIECQ
jgi:hypothetical protein